MNNDISQKAIEHVEQAVRNIRRGLALSGFELKDEQLNTIYAKKREQQMHMLEIWESILAAVTFPKDITVDEVHKLVINVKGENDVLKILNESLQERLDMAHDKIRVMKAHEVAVDKLKNMCIIQSTKGNYDVNDYMRGMANGLILAVSCFTDKEPEFIEAPTIDDIKEEPENG